MRQWNAYVTVKRVWDSETRMRLWNTYVTVKHVCDPWYFQEIRQQMLEEDTAAQAAPPQPIVTQPTNTNAINLAVLVIFGVFAFVVRTMISSLNWADYAAGST